MNFGELLNEAISTPFSGWDFSHMGERWVENTPDWSYEELAVSLLGQSRSTLDMGTGGGEFLAGLKTLAPKIAATEGYEPNLAIARQRLSPLGIEVHEVKEDKLPFSDESFDLVINRHESFDCEEVKRVLSRGGRFLTQQVGGQNYLEINDTLLTGPRSFSDWNLESAVNLLAEGGWRVEDTRECFPEAIFKDIGALIYYLLHTPWQIEDFSIEKYRSILETLHQKIENEGGFTVRAHRFLIEAVRL